MLCWERNTEGLNIKGLATWNVEILQSIKNSSNATASPQCENIDSAPPSEAKKGCCWEPHVEGMATSCTKFHDRISGIAVLSRANDS